MSGPAGTNLHNLRGIFATRASPVQPSALIRGVAPPSGAEGALTTTWGWTGWILDDGR
jgi:hypothetical protein